MNIIAHKGIWKSSEEQNTLQAFHNAFQTGVGIECDLRDKDGDIIVSHDPLLKDQPFLLFSDFLQLYSEKGNDLPLMLNVKSSEISKSIFLLLNNYYVKNYYLFDMAIPDMVKYATLTDRSLCRVSEIEYPNPNLERVTCGYLFDSFDSSFVDLLKQRKEILNKGKPIFLISPELHEEDHLEYWSFIRENDTSKMHLCTDLVEEARVFFNE